MINSKILNVLLVLFISTAFLIIFVLGYSRGFIFYITLFCLISIIMAYQLRQKIKRNGGKISYSEKISIYRTLAVLILCFS
jgi:hypothetical protein